MTEETYVGGEEEYAEFWNHPHPEPGASISGKIVRIHVMQGDYGPTPVVTLDTVDGQKAVLVRGTVFREEMAERHPKVGDQLEVTYLGAKKPKSGKGIPYHVYKPTGGPEREFNWNKFVDSGRQGWGADEPPIPSAPIPQTNPAAQQFVPAVPASKGPSVQERAAEQFGDAPPF